METERKLLMFGSAWPETQKGQGFIALVCGVISIHPGLIWHIVCRKNSIICITALKLSSRDQEEGSGKHCLRAQELAVFSHSLRSKAPAPAQYQRVKIFIVAISLAFCQFLDNNKTEKNTLIKTSITHVAINNSCPFSISLCICFHIFFLHIENIHTWGLEKWLNDWEYFCFCRGPRCSLQ